MQREQTLPLCGFSFSPFYSLHLYCIYGFCGQNIRDVYFSTKKIVPFCLNLQEYTISKSWNWKLKNYRLTSKDPQPQINFHSSKQKCPPHPFYVIKTSLVSSPTRHVSVSNKYYVHLKIIISLRKGDHLQCNRLKWDVQLSSKNLVQCPTLGKVQKSKLPFYAYLQKTFSFAKTTLYTSWLQSRLAPWERVNITISASARIKNNLHAMKDFVL